MTNPNQQLRKLDWPIVPLNIQYQGPALTGLACAAVSPRGTEFVIVAEDVTALDLILSELRAHLWDTRFFEPVHLIKSNAEKSAFETPEPAAK